MAETMLAKNALSAKMAECYITIGDQTYNAMNAINLEVTFEKNKTEVPILGRMNKGHKSTGSTITGSAEFHFNTSLWRELAYNFQETGEDVYFDMLVRSKDLTASDTGGQDVWFYGCNFDSVILAAFDADSDDSLTESLDFTVERFELKTKFNKTGGLNEVSSTPV
jgi:hypothetical protein